MQPQRPIFRDNWSSKRTQSHIDPPKKQKVSLVNITLLIVTKGNFCLRLKVFRKMTNTL